MLYCLFCVLQGFCVLMRVQSLEKAPAGGSSEGVKHACTHTQSHTQHPSSHTYCLTGWRMHVCMSPQVSKIAAKDGRPGFHYSLSYGKKVKCAHVMGVLLHACVCERARTHTCNMVFWGTNRACTHIHTHTHTNRTQSSMEDKWTSADDLDELVLRLSKQDLSGQLVVQSPAMVVSVNANSPLCFLLVRPQGACIFLARTRAHACTHRLTLARCTVRV